MTRRWWLTCVVVLIAVSAVVASARAGDLTIYFIDVEGGQATLIVTPAGESLLIDTGFPSTGTFASKPGDPQSARDAQRILAAARDAGISRLDYLMLTHYHADHAGGVVEVAGLLPVGTYIGHAAPTPEADKAVSGTQGVYDAYVGIRPQAKHIQPKAGDRLTLHTSSVPASSGVPIGMGGGVDLVFVATEGDVISKPVAGVTQSASVCEGTGVPAQEKTENPRSTAMRLQYGRFSFLDVGDLSGPALFALTCPTNLIGDTDVYLVSHHGGDDAADPAMFKTIKPLVAILNNSSRKGAQAHTMATLKQLPSIDTWQLHRTLNEGAENTAEERIVNLDDTTHTWLKLVAQADGSFAVTNGRTGSSKRYKR